MASVHKMEIKCLSFESFHLMMVKHMLRSHHDPIKILSQKKHGGEEKKKKNKVSRNF